ncbi:ABC-type multidrug transport system, permease component [Marinitoga piezophila KA3]|uniref:Transport permease protein n=1 Tax=Marinitoga piezophila (strain DSM 14283 / JCM 11233 / KA3) TaxID=443254 RepID=H2J571_MARPK|nr:ABC transporter permease [Marinitoga piezophila]AEX84929.1 ABC-type multidrug transport system, permease component [Marinitoga piezophila KA3]
MNKIYILSKYITRDIIKNKGDMFFVIFFPVILLIIFGFVFEQQNSKSIVALYADSNYYKNELDKIYNVIPEKSENDVKDSVKKGKANIGIYISEYNAIIFYNSSDIKNSQDINFLELTLKKLLIKNRSNIKNDYIVVRENKVLTTEKEHKYIDFLLAGLIGISLLSNGMFSVITLFGKYKKQNILKRFILIPMNPIEFVIGFSISRIFMTFISSIILIYAGKIIFSSTITVNWNAYIILALNATFGMMGLGLLFLFFFKNTETAQNAASAFFTLMMFFSGVYFPIEFLPKYFQPLSYILPTKYVIDGIRYTFGIDNMKIQYLVFLNIVLLITGIFLLIIASKKFLMPEK